MNPGLVQAQPSSPSPGSQGGFARVARRALFARLGALEGGHLLIRDSGAVHHFGDRNAELRAEIHVHSPHFYTAVARRGSVGAGEAYMDGDWTSDDLPTLIRILARNTGLQQVDRGAARLAQPGLKLLHALRDNVRRTARRNIAAHYDLGNSFFALFLDPSLTYSCAIFERDGMSLEEAQAAKYDRLCRKLEIDASDHVLEIGGGWGGFAMHAAGTYGCRVTSATISSEQYDLSRKRIAAAGLEDRIEVVFSDYRDLQGRFDKLVSIEMIEAVGHRHLPEFFRVCSERLQPEGRMALQAILVRDQDWENSLRNVDFVKRYIFPGGQLVSLKGISQCLATQTDLRVTHLEDITEHYVETLLRWRRAMLGNLDALRALGLGDVFLRMWDFYLCYCAGGFAERQILDQQIVFAKGGARDRSLAGRLS